MKLPHPVILLVAGVAVVRRADVGASRGRVRSPRRSGDGPPRRRRRHVSSASIRRPSVRSPLLVAIPRGFVEAADVIGVVLFVGAAWVVVDRIGTLGRLIAALVASFGSRGLIAIPVISLFFATMGALENMQEEIIPLVPALLLLGRGLGVDAVTVVAMSAGAAVIGSAFGPTNPFQAGIAMKLAQLPPMSAAPLRWTMFAAALVLWVAWTMWHAARTGIAAELETSEIPRCRSPARALGEGSVLILLIAIAPIAAYVYGSVALGWGFNELSGGFLIAGCVGGIARRPRRGRHDDGLSRRDAGDAAGGHADRRRAQHFARADRRPRHRHDPERPCARRSRARRRPSRRC